MSVHEPAADIVPRSEVTTSRANATFRLPQLATESPLLEAVGSKKSDRPKTENRRADELVWPVRPSGSPRPLANLSDMTSSRPVTIADIIRHEYELLYPPAAKPVAGNRNS